MNVTPETGTNFLRSIKNESQVATTTNNQPMNEQTMNDRAISSGDTDRRAPAIKYEPRSKRSYFDVGIGSICLSGPETGGKYCLLEMSLASGISVPRHTHTREDQGCYILAGELEVIVGEEVFILKAGDTLMAPRDVPHQLRNSGSTENHYLLIFSPPDFECFLKETAVPAPDNAVAPTERQLRAEDPSIAIRNVHELAADYGIQFD
jgi:quercetin dioxygenase-like cupin family protein